MCPIYSALSKHMSKGSFTVTIYFGSTRVVPAQYQCESGVFWNSYSANYSDHSFGKHLCGRKLHCVW